MTKRTPLEQFRRDVQRDMTIMLFVYAAMVIGSICVFIAI